MLNPSKAQFSGISFPPRKSGLSGFWATATDEQLIKESIYVILNTRKGEMPMNPNFGTSMDNNVFELMGKSMQGIVCQQIKQDIETWEPRVSVKSVSSYSKEDLRIFNIDLVIKATGIEFNTDVPFNA